MMKKRFAILLALLLLLSAFTACGEKNNSDEKSNLQTDDAVAPTFERVESLNAANKVQTIGDDVIYDCFTFESVDSESVMITAFYSQTAGKTTAADAESQSYVRCLVPHTVRVPQTLAGKTVVKIGGSAFRQHTEIADLILPETLTYIGQFAFEECSNLQTVTLPSAVSEIGIGAFYRCSGLLELNFASESSLSIIPKSAFAFCTSLTTLHIPGYIKTVGEGAFLNCTSMEELSLEEGLETIENQAFQNLNLTQTPTIPSTVKSIGELNFE